MSYGFCGAFKDKIEKDDVLWGKRVVGKENTHAYMYQEAVVVSVGLKAFCSKEEVSIGYVWRHIGIPT